MIDLHIMVVVLCTFLSMIGAYLRVVPDRVNSLGQDVHVTIALPITFQFTH